ncbi:hypothetical protein ACVJGD_005553 [Bradyrhizobium sp. USDA 10063]
MLSNANIETSNGLNNKMAVWSALGVLGIGVFALGGFGWKLGHLSVREPLQQAFVRVLKFKFQFDSKPFFASPWSNLRYHQSSRYLST